MAISFNVLLRYIVFSFLSPTEPSENFREILQNVAKPHGVSNMRKLGHLNNFIKVKRASGDAFWLCLCFVAVPTAPLKLWMQT